MHDDKDFSGELADLGDDEIEIEFVDVDDDVSSTEPEPEPEPAADRESGIAVSEAAGSEKAEQLQKELDHVRDIYLRKLAEFDNFRKRVDREREEVRMGAQEDFIRELLPVIDNFERALQHADDDSGAFHQGIEMIAKQLHDTLVRKGVAEIDPQGEVFDPEVHEAVQRVEGADQPPGTIVFVMLKGYTLGDRLIRPAMVGVAVEPNTSEGDAGGES
jgi:molecular chaperone GrpE